MNVVRIDRSLVEPTKIEREAWKEAKDDLSCAYARNGSGDWETFSEPGDAFLELTGPGEYTHVAIGAYDTDGEFVCFMFTL